MRDISAILLCLFLISATVQTKPHDLRDFFLRLNYNTSIRTLYDSVELRNEFDHLTLRDNFQKGAEFRAKFTGSSNIYTGADSIILHTVTCNDMRTFSDTTVDDCKSIKVLYYLNAAEMQGAYTRLDSLMLKTITSTNPEWKNHSGAAKGVYFLTDKIYPFITIDRHNSKISYLSISYTSYDH